MLGIHKTNIRQGGNLCGLHRPPRYPLDGIDLREIFNIAKKHPGSPPVFGRTSSYM
jgi:hypothetical protein